MTARPGTAPAADGGLAGAGLAAAEPHLRAAIRAAGYVLLFLVCLPAQLLGLGLRCRLRETVPVGFNRLTARWLGLGVEVTGRPAAGRPVLFVANHISYFDIILLGSLVPARFIAKREVAGWPGIGLLARLQRSLFIERRASRSGEQVAAMNTILGSGDNLILFAEGTCGDGLRVLPFKSTLLGPVEEAALRGRLTVQPVSIVYRRLNRAPIGRALLPLVAWYGDMTLVPHLWTALGLGRITAAVRFHEPMPAAAFATRKAATAFCRQAVAAGVARSLTGRD